jgi:DNA adenine methylase
MKPFLKWAGGKRWLASRFRDFTETLKFKRYVEPFVGGGAVFFHICPKRAILSDRNKALMGVYEAIKTDWEAVLDFLVIHQRRHSTTYYYRMRDCILSDPIARAAQFIYLNRTCWNGLYRENREGRFNVPKGTKSTVIFPDDDFKGISRVLQTTRLASDDFETIIQKTEKTDLVFVDPPYTVNHVRNGFLRYNEKIFSWGDQVRLRDIVRAKAAEGVKLIVTNAFHPSITKLYEGFAEVTPLARHSVLSGVGQYRVETKEVIITVGLEARDILLEPDRDTARLQLRDG